VFALSITGLLPIVWRVVLILITSAQPLVFAYSGFFRSVLCGSVLSLVFTIDIDSATPVQQRSLQPSYEAAEPALLSDVGDKQLVELQDEALEKTISSKRFRTNFCDPLFVFGLYYKLHKIHEAEFDLDELNNLYAVYLYGTSHFGGRGAATTVFDMFSACEVKNLENVVISPTGKTFVRDESLD
jgi:hypothetical protein